MHTCSINGHLLFIKMPKRNIYNVDYSSYNQRGDRLKLLTKCDIPPLTLKQIQSSGDSITNLEEIIDMRSPEGGYSWYDQATQTCDPCTSGSANLGSVASAF